MEDKNKYYTPSLEEFHVGFIYERCDDGYNYFEDVFPRAIDFKHSNCEYEDFLKRHIQYFRVKYLDKEDIESLGWTLIKTGNAFSDKALIFELKIENCFNTGINYILTKHSHRLIDLDYQTYSSYNTYKGCISFNIKNKSELKLLMKQIGIK